MPGTADDALRYVPVHNQSELLLGTAQVETEGWRIMISPVTFIPPCGVRVTAWTWLHAELP